ncbi:MAG: LysM peptidoglycan-binding domain-containing protein [Bacilli bacterium]|nr:LysM peptidoglycan-binding domain-containing protein [Bacilli bacterium]
MKLGIDISSLDDIDYSLLKKNNISFVIIKGDTSFNKHYYNLLKNKIDIGVYFESKAKCKSELVKEVDTLLNILDDKVFSYPIFLSITNLDTNIEEVIKYYDFVLKREGYYFGIYSNLSIYKSILNKYDYEYWISIYDDKKPDIKLGIWQNTNDFYLGKSKLRLSYSYKDYSKIIKEKYLNNNYDFKPDVYIIKKGDTINKISKKYNIQKEILKNNISLEPGSTINIDNL